MATNKTDPNRRDLFPRMLTLFEVMQAMTSTLEPEELLQRIVAAVTRALPCEGCILWLYDEKERLLRPSTIHGFTWEEVGDHRFAPGEGTIGTAFAERQAVIVNDLRVYHKFVRKGEVVDRIVSLLDVPMITEGRPIGVLDATNKIPDHDFNEDDSRLLFLLATQAAIAIRNAQIHEQVRRKAQELEILHSITQVIGTHLEPQDVVQIIADHTARITAFDECSVFIKERNEDGLVLAATTGSRQVGKLRIPPGEGLLAEVAQTRQAQVCTGAALQQVAQHGDGDYAQIQTAVAAAMVHADRLLGVVELRDSTVRNLSDSELALLVTVVRQMAVFLEKAQLYQTVQDMYLEVIKSLSEAVEAKDPETIGHCARVSRYAALIATEMGLTEALVEQIRIAAYLHDIGKIGVPEAILLKPGRVTPEEYEVLKCHSEIGAKILKPIEWFGQVSLLVKHHHERFDGAGYPSGLTGEDIPLGARIVAVADSYEVMTYSRPYSAKRTSAAALAELERCAGSQFDPAVVGAFREVFAHKLGENSTERGNEPVV